MTIFSYELYFCILIKNVIKNKTFNFQKTIRDEK